MICFIASQMFGNYYTQKWAYSDENDQIDKFYFYFSMILGLNLLSAILIFIRANFQVFAGLKVGKKLHNQLIAYVFRAPINLFFDVTPIGKILNRFSKDMAVIDEQIYFNIGGFLVCLWQSIACLIVASVAVPYILAIIAFFMILSICLFKYAMKGYTDCYRIESVVMSPILSFFQETFNGGSVIRAFNKDEEFREHTFSMINKQAVANAVTMGVWGWYSIRLIFLSIVVLVAGCAVCCLFRGKVDPVLLSMMLQYLLTLQSYCLYMLYFYGEIERKMVSV